MAGQPRQDTYDYLVKGMMVGDRGVGKSCLLLRETDDSFTPSVITTGEVNFTIKTYNKDHNPPVFNGKMVKGQWWDSPGEKGLRTRTPGESQRFRTVTTGDYQGTMVYFLVYDVTDEQSFQNIRNWIRNLQEQVPDDVSFVLIGNKCDMDHKRAVETSRGQAFANEYGIPFFETSAKTGINVNKAFTKGLELGVDKLSLEKQRLQQRQPALAQPEAKKIPGWLWALMTLTMLPIWLYGVYKIGEAIGKRWKGKPAERDAIPGWQWALMTVTFVPMLIYGVYKTFQSIGNWWKGRNAGAGAPAAVLRPAQPAAHPPPHQFAPIHQPVQGPSLDEKRRREAEAAAEAARRREAEANLRERRAEQKLAEKDQQLRQLQEEKEHAEQEARDLVAATQASLEEARKAKDQPPVVDAKAAEASNTRRTKATAALVEAEKEKTKRITAYEKIVGAEVFQELRVNPPDHLAGDISEELLIDPVFFGNKTCERTEALRQARDYDYDYDGIALVGDDIYSFIKPNTKVAEGVQAHIEAAAAKKLAGKPGDAKKMAGRMSYLRGDPPGGPQPPADEEDNHNPRPPIAPRDS